MALYQSLSRAFRHTAVWRSLRGVSWMRSGVLLALELQKSVRERSVTSLDAVDRDFRLRTDPFNYLTNPVEQARFGVMRDMLDAARAGTPFTRALEIGGAEGAFTDVLVDRCDALVELDLSPTALARNRARHGSRAAVEFRRWDLLTDPLPGTFDLIVVAGVLEYCMRGRTLRSVRTKLVDGLTPGGHLLLESTRSSDVIENAWWAPYVIRGKRINDLMAEDDRLEIVASEDTDEFAIALCRRRATRPGVAHPRRGAELPSPSLPSPAT